MPDVMYVIYVKYDIFDMYGALTYTICMYVNMGVKRRVRTSGMQPIIVDILQILEKYVVGIFLGVHFLIGGIKI